MKSDSDLNKKWQWEGREMDKPQRYLEGDIDRGCDWWDMRITKTDDDAIDFWGQVIVCCGATLCTVGGLAASLTSAH